MAESKLHSPTLRGSIPARYAVGSIGWGAVRAIVGAVLAISAVGCVSVEADVQDVVVTRQGLEISGSMMPVDLGEQEITVRFDHPYEGVDLPAGVNSELRPTGVMLTAASGVSDFSFLRAFSVTIGSTAPEAPPPAVVFEYQSQGDGPVGHSIDISPARSPNVLDYWETTGAYYELTVRGDLPELLWAVDVAIEFSGKLSVEI